MYYYKKIEDYIDGLLDETEQRAFEIAMSEDKKLAEEVEKYKDAKIISEGLLEIDIMETIEKLSKKGATDNLNVVSINRNKFFSFRKMMMAASFVGVLIIAGWWAIGNTKIDNKKLYQEPIWPIERSGTESILSNASIMYLNGDFESAKALLTDSIKNKDLGKLWIAEMYLKNEEFDSAFQYLSSIESLNSEKNRIIYLKVLIAIKKDNLQEAKEFCKELPIDEYKYLYEKLKI